MEATGFAARLQAEALSGQPLEFLRQTWSQIEEAVRRDPDSIEAAFHDAVAAKVLPPASAVALAESISFAVVRSDGGVETADPRFTAWREGVSDREGLRSLAVRAMREGECLGSLDTIEGRVAAWAGLAEAAARWPLSEAARQALAAGRDRVAVVVFAPSRSSELADRMASAFDFSPAQARLAEALLFAPSLEIAAAQVGVGRETARDTLRRIMAKAGVNRLGALVSRLVELMCAGGAGEMSDEQILISTFGLSASEARAAARAAEGMTAGQTADDLGLKTETVRGYLKTALAKTGVPRARDLGRLLVEARELAVLAGVADPVFESAKTAGRLRVVADPATERQIALIDYGPRSGRPVLVFHGYAAGRTLPQPLVRGLQAAGCRPIAPQRPGYGLTSPAAGDYLACAAADLHLIIDSLGLRGPRILARDGGVAVALEFARRWPGLAERFVLLNPRTPAAFAPKRKGMMAVVTRGLLGHPKLVAPFAELLRRNSGSRAVEENLRQICGKAAADLAVLEDRGLVDGMVRDIQALLARSGTGFVAEHALFATGWLPPEDIEDGDWIVAHSGDLPGDPDGPWQGLPNVRFEIIQGAGFLVPFTHPKALIELLTGETA